MRVAFYSALASRRRPRLAVASPLGTGTVHIVVSLPRKSLVAQSRPSPAKVATWQAKVAPASGSCAVFRVILARGAHSCAAKTASLAVA